jgi:molybdenum cofactor cytidylyltransferase
MSRIACALLAAGGSRRFGDDSKLMADLGGTPLVAHAAEAVAAAGFDFPLAVCRSDDESAALMRAAGLHVLFNPRADEGMGTSIACAASHAIDLEADGLLICLGDMPFVAADTLRRMGDALDPAETRTIVAAKDDARRGAPTLFGRGHFFELAKLDGDEGAKSIVRASQAAVIEVACAPGELDDIDTAEALDAARARLAQRD